MSDSPNGPDWWLGTDGKWYPPVAPAESQPAGRSASGEGRGEGGDDPGGGGDPAVTPPAPPVPRKRRAWVGIVVAVAILVVVAAVVVLRPGGESAEDGYVEALEDAGLHEWVTDRAAVNVGYAVCDELDAGRPTRGSEQDRIAVEHLCADYVEAFRVLETAQVEGSFVVVDDDFEGESGSRCSPSGGYGDINSSTQVVVRNPAGDELARTSLGPGEIERRGRCTFTFELALTEGETTYIVEVGDRGELGYTWEEVTLPGTVSLVLGD